MRSKSASFMFASLLMGGGGGGLRKEFAPLGAFKQKKIYSI